MAPRMTTQTQAVLKQFLDAPAKRRYGYEIATAAGLKSGTLYPILARLERDGLLTSEMENAEASAVGRRPRRYYTITGAGERVAREALVETHRLLFTRPGVAGGAP